MTDVWIVLVQDRHTDVEALPFSSEPAALTAAREQAAANARDPADISEPDLSQDMVRLGWVLYLRYSVEGDHVRVIRRQMDG